MTLKFRHKPTEIEAEILYDVEIINTDHGEVVGRPCEVKIKKSVSKKPYKMDLDTFLDSYIPADDETARKLKEILEGL